MSLSTGSMRGGRTRKFKAEINVVPYIDVMLVLLVIFMVVSPLTNPSVINLPTAGKTTQPPDEYLQIELKADATATLGIKGKKGEPVTSESAPTRAVLAQKLRSMHNDNPDMAVMISADKDIRYEEVVQVISEARKIGIPRVGLATK